MRNPKTDQPVEILLVEDNPGDIHLIVEAFREGKIDKNIHVAKNGVEALAFVKQQGRYQNAPTPRLIVLDLNLPKKNGHQVLAEIKADVRLRRIPVIVLTTSEAEEDIRQAYELQANCYTTKVFDLDQFLEIIKQIEEFWLTIVKIPEL
jgi:CheY-like chemotaxis protein